MQICSQPPFEVWQGLSDAPKDDEGGEEGSEEVLVQHSGRSCKDGVEV